jgi:hypothetical protein
VNCVACDSEAHSPRRGALVSKLPRSRVSTSKSPGFGKLDQQDHADLRKLIQRDQVPATLTIQHADKNQIMLTIPDLIAGARTDVLCAVDSVPFAMISHLVRIITVDV